MIRELAAGLLRIAAGAGRDSYVACAIRAAGDGLSVAETFEDVRAALSGLSEAIAPLR